MKNEEQEENAKEWVHPEVLEFRMEKKDYSFANEIEAYYKLKKNKIKQRLQGIIKKATLAALMFYTVNWGSMGGLTGDWSLNPIHQYNTYCKNYEGGREYIECRRKLEKLADTNRDGNLDGVEFTTMLDKLGVKYNSKIEYVKSGKVIYSFLIQGEAPTPSQLESAMRSYDD